MTETKTVRLPNPDLQVDFSACLAAARKAYLLEALSAVVGELDIPELDAELARYVPDDYMRALASIGLRAELVFPAPMILEQNPRLLSYYRLLLGHSQKAFYEVRNRTTPFRCMEGAGTLPKTVQLDGLCKELIRGLSMLVDGIGVKRISRELIDDLTLLTLGPQLRGGANVKKGSVSIQAVFELIHTIIRPSIIAATDKRLVLKNAAGRRVIIQFASDPDIVIREEIGKDSYRNIIAIEVKGGTDFSNIHNRIGEAEKSHHKARQTGYVECWTIVNVHKLDGAKAKSESPSTDRFFRLSEIIQTQSAEYADFMSRVIALTGLSERKAHRTRGSSLS
ncbi:MAG: XcyI family restriction endonuclease [Planctomycetota bacterium]